MAMNRNMAVVGQGPMMEMTCVLRVNPQCPECKNKLNEVLQCTRGQYSSITVDGEAHKVKITGRADPNQLMQVLSRTNDRHGEAMLIQINNNALRGSADDQRYYNYDHGNPYSHDPRDDTYAYNIGHYQHEPYYDQNYYRQRRCSCNIL